MDGCSCKPGGSGVIREINLQVTNRCNLRCIHCSVDSGRLKLPELSFNEIVKVLDDAMEFRPEEMHITGGEPLLREDVFDIIHEGKARNFFIQLQTNGTVLTQFNLDRVLDCEANRLVISVDGADAAMHNSIRGWDNAFQKTLDTIRTLLASGISVRVNTVVMKRNMHQMPELMRTMIELGVDVHTFFYFSPVGRGRNIPSEWIGPEEWGRFVSMLKGHYDSLPPSKTRVTVERSSYGSEDQARMGSECRAYNRDLAYIRSDGNVYPCIFFVLSPYSLGNVRQQPFNSIWKNSKTWEIFDKLPDENPCAGCKLLASCRGGCRGYAYAHLNKPLSPDPRCDKGKLVFPACPIICSPLREWKG